MDVDDMMRRLDHVTQESVNKCKRIHEMCELIEVMSALEKFKVKHGIVSQKAKPEHRHHSIGYSEKEKKWYGWSHCAIFGFGVGDKIFKENFGDDKTHFSKHGTETIKNMADAEKSARAFAKSVA
jgi:hypothetical protein